MNYKLILKKSTKMCLMLFKRKFIWKWGKRCHILNKKWCPSRHLNENFNLFAMVSSFSAHVTKFIQITPIYFIFHPYQRCTRLSHVQIHVQPPSRLHLLCIHTFISSNFVSTLMNSVYYSYEKYKKKTNACAAFSHFICENYPETKHGMSKKLF